MEKHSLEITSPDREMAEGADLAVMGSADLSAGAALRLQFTGGQPVLGQAISIEDSGARAVIEVEGERWCLSRGSTVRTGAEVLRLWTVDGRWEEHVRRMPSATWSSSG